MRARLDCPAPLHRELVRAQGRLLPATVSLKTFVQLDDDADGSDEPVRIDARHGFTVYWAPAIEVA